MISYIERTYFNDLLNRGGYVLDFSTYRFDEFTSHSVGIALCETYNLSKGKSLNEFINEGDNDKVVKLLDDLLEYYKVRYSLDVNVNIRMYNFDDVQCTVIPSVAYGFVTGMNLQLC